jgi:phosphatidyl-myo-inositol dimannoside synthase
VRILFLAADLFGSHGGIARHCRAAVKAMTESPSVELVDVISLLDQRGGRPDERYFGPHGRAYVACGGSRAEFVARVAQALCRQYDLVIAGHVHFAPLLPLARAKRVTFIYGIDAWSRLPWLRRASLQRSHRVLAISRFTADAASRANDVDRQAIEVVPCCLDPFLYGEATASDGASTELAHNSLLTVARLSLAESSKGHEVVLRAMPRVLDAVPDASYAIVGDGDLRPLLEDISARLGLSERVRFYGALTDQEVQSCYRTCTAYVMPSRWEGFGLVFLEAMAHGRPIIASTRDAGAEVVGEAALLVDPEDTPAVAETIIELLRTPELQVRYGQAGQARLAAHFTYERFRESLLSRLEQCAA